MPKLSTKIHLSMFSKGKSERSLRNRIVNAAKALFGKNDIYGVEWGDPEVNPPLQYVRDQFLLPYVKSDSNLVEIGPGGGRWTRYMLHAKTIYAIDYHQEILGELKSNIKSENIQFIKNNGDDFPGVPEESIDIVFSFGTFVHLDVEIIRKYLENIKPLLKRNANVIIQYSDKTKPLGASNEGFSENDPDKMRKMVLSCGYTIYEEDTKTLWHSSIIRFG